MDLPFTNRTQELRELDAAAQSGGLLVIFGRRRVGKTRLLAHWLKSRTGLYSQAIEGARDIQLDQVFRDFREGLGAAVVPKTWAELFELLSLNPDPAVVCLDEFPYLVASDPTLPSVLQRWLDHKRPKRTLLILAGSSTRMMHDLFLNRSAPLYGRARKVFQVQPMGYGAFCGACGLPSGEMDSFARFSLVGGIPKYWEFVEPKEGPVELAERLFFGFAPYLDQEPARVLRDEGVAGLNAVSLLEAIGRGAAKPSEIAARLGTAQTNLSRLFQQLLDASLLEREIPFGESLRTTKRALYRIQDPTLRFWFRVYSSHRSRWHTYAKAEKGQLIHGHAATVFEDACRQLYPEAARYWEPRVEFDFVRPGPAATLVVSEAKWRKLTGRERAETLKKLEEQWEVCELRKRYTEANFEVLDAGMLGAIAL